MVGALIGTRPDALPNTRFQPSRRPSQCRLQHVTRTAKLADQQPHELRADTADRGQADPRVALGERGQPCSAHAASWSCSCAAGSRRFTAAYTLSRAISSRCSRSAIVRATRIESVDRSGAQLLARALSRSGPGRLTSTVGRRASAPTNSTWRSVCPRCARAPAAARPRFSRGRLRSAPVAGRAAAPLAARVPSRSACPTDPGTGR